MLGAQGRGRFSLLRVGAPVWVLACVAVLCLVVGFAVGGFVVSPDDAASRMRPPPVGLITAPVETRELTASVVQRADVSFADPVVVSPSTPEGAEVAVITGRVPTVGAAVTAGEVLLEVSGRPVIVLPGRFPAYRTMGPGSVGPDVQQLRDALKGLGYSAGNGGKTYDSALAAAVAKLYQAAGYPAPGSQDWSKAQAVTDATDALSDAKDAQTQANRTVAEAKRLPTDERAAALTAANESLKQANRGVTRAQAALDAARMAAWTPMPISEVVFVTGLPRRVDAVNVRLGQDLATMAVSNNSASSGPTGAVVLSGAQITATALVTNAESKLLKKDGPAVLTATDGTLVAGKIESICDAGEAVSDIPDCPVGIAIDPAAAPAEALVGNLLVTFEVGKTSSESLAVPVAAVSADSSGQARVEVVVGDLTPNAAAADQRTQMVMITTGLSAQGFVEVVSSSPQLQAGDLVVVGRAVDSGAAPAPKATP